MCYLNLNFYIPSYNYCPCYYYYYYYYRVRQKSKPLKFFAVFSATVWNFNLRFYSIIY